jgi:hypothetical protein
MKLAERTWVPLLISADRRGGLAAVIGLSATRPRFPRPIAEGTGRSPAPRPSRGKAGWHRTFRGNEVCRGVRNCQFRSIGQPARDMPPAGLLPACPGAATPAPGRRVAEPSLEFRGGLGTQFGLPQSSVKVPADRSRKISSPSSRPSAAGGLACALTEGDCGQAVRGAAAADADQP